MAWRKRLEEAEAYSTKSSVSDRSSFRQRDGAQSNHPVIRSQLAISPDYSFDEYSLGERNAGLPNPTIMPSGESTFIGNIQEFAGIGIGFAGIFGEIILSHPFLVFRRQCQIRPDSQYSHLTPFSVVPVMRRFAISQGLGSLWKGITSVFIVRGLGMIGDTVISEVTPLPKDISRHSSSKKILQHLLLKCLSSALCASFYAANLVEMVQSDIASEPPSLVSCIKEGLRRWFFLSPSAARLMPLWKLIPGVVVLQISRYIIHGTVEMTTKQYLRGAEVDMDLGLETTAEMEDVYEQYYSDLVSTFMGSLAADVVLYPLECVVHRLCVQGTRVIIDNVDTGIGVTPVMASYDGFRDVIRSIVQQEGSTGFYKGFGALLLQYAVHFSLLYLAKTCYEQLLIAHSSKRDRRSMGSTSQLRGSGEPANVSARQLRGPR